MKLALLTDAGTKEQVLVVFGTGAAVFAKPAKDDEGTFTEIFNIDQEIIVTVTETVNVIHNITKFQQ